MHNSTHTDLFSPVSFGAINASNRIVMAPVTRSRYCEEGIPMSCMPSITLSEQVQG